MTAPTLLRSAAGMVAVALLGVLAGCGNNGAAPAGTPTPTLRLSPTAVAPAAGIDPLPAHDTSLAEAPAELATLWQPYGVTLIPGKDVFANQPPAPGTAIRGNGGLSDTEAQAIGQAYIREGSLGTWAHEHRQIALLARLDGQPFILGKLGVAMAEGTAVHTPPCSVYPTEITVYAASPEIRAVFERRLQPISTMSFPLKLTFAGPCAITGTTNAGREVTLDEFQTFTVLCMANLRHDPVLGTITYLEDAVSCEVSTVKQFCGG